MNRCLGNVDRGPPYYSLIVHNHNKIHRYYISGVSKNIIENAIHDATMMRFIHELPYVEESGGKYCYYSSIRKSFSWSHRLLLCVQIHDIDQCSFFHHYYTTRR